MFDYYYSVVAFSKTSTSRRIEPPALDLSFLPLRTLELQIHLLLRSQVSLYITPYRQESDDLAPWLLDREYIFLSISVLLQRLD